MLRRWRALRVVGARAASRGARRSVGDALLDVQRQLRPRESARAEAKALVANALRPRLVNSNDVIFQLDREMTEEEAAVLEVAAERRSKGEPLAYVIGTKEFWSMQLKVTSDTLIPRADSEVLIETLVDLYDKDAELSILDVGTGSGCLLLAALSEFPNAKGVGIDISPGALNVARENAEIHGLAHRTAFLQRDLRDIAEGLPLGSHEAQLSQQFDVVLSNPPYIPRSELDLVAPDVLDFEPHAALFSDPDAVARSLTAEQQDVEEDDGLRMYSLLKRALPFLLKPTEGSARLKQSVLVEIGSEAQANAVRGMFTGGELAVGLELKSSKMLMDGRNRHRGVLFQTR